MLSRVIKREGMIIKCPINDLFHNVVTVVTVIIFNMALFQRFLSLYNFYHEYWKILVVSRKCHQNANKMILQFYLTILTVVLLFRLGPGLFLVKEINNGNRNNELMSCPKSVLKLLTLLQNSCKRIIILFLRWLFCSEHS